MFKQVKSAMTFLSQIIKPFTHFSFFFKILLLVDLTNKFLDNAKKSIIINIETEDSSLRSE